MNPRAASFLLAVAALAVWRIAVLFLHRKPTMDAAEEPQQWRLWQLFLASFLTLFLELAVIRWIAVEVRIFAYVKNLALLVCFLGFGFGCALARKPARWMTAANALLGLFLIVRWPWNGRVMEGLSQGLGAANDVEIWGTGESKRWMVFLAAAALAGLLLLLITYIFVPLGQVVSRQIETAPSALYGYSWNLGGSLLGILGFLAICRWMLPPAIWFGVALAGFALLQSGRRERYLMACLIVPAILFLHDPSTPDHFSLWSPYQQIEFTRIGLPDGELAAANLQVNHTGYQYIVNLSPEFLARHPEVASDRGKMNAFNLPFLFGKPQPSVLIVGAGAGNDAAGALRNGSRAVDAVEIDPAILELGRRYHPEHPYDSPEVAVYLTDARNFMRRNHKLYDLIVFGALDSHTEFSDYSNMRLDNFVYTLESFREARRHLAPEGVLMVKFQVNRPWMGQRLQALLTQAFAKPPTVFEFNLTSVVPGTCFVISDSGQIEKALAGNPALAAMVAGHPPRFAAPSDVPITTDDWPYLYQAGRWIPHTYFSVGLLVVLLAISLYWQVPGARGRTPSLFFFAMGAGFLLLETQAISRLALYFGTTWQVNAIAIGALLATLLAANLTVEMRAHAFGRVGIAVGLVAALLAAYLIPFGRIPGSTVFVGWIVALVFAVPVFFAGLLFAEEFRGVESAGSALAANMLGAVCGGLLENVSLIAGMRALLLVALGLYLLALCGLALRPSAPASAV